MYTKRFWNVTLKKNSRTNIYRTEIAKNKPVYLMHLKITWLMENPTSIAKWYFTFTQKKNAILTLIFYRYSVSRKYSTALQLQIYRRRPYIFLYDILSSVHSEFFRGSFRISFTYSRFFIKSKAETQSSCRNVLIIKFLRFS